MCRNIKTLFNFEPPVTDDEVRAASLQFVRKITGFNKPSKANEAAFQAAIEDVARPAAVDFSPHHIDRPDALGTRGEVIDEPDGGLCGMVTMSPATFWMARKPSRNASRS